MILHYLLDCYEQGKWQIRGELKQENFKDQGYHVILFDAFSGKSTPNLWTEDFLKQFLQKMTVSKIKSPIKNSPKINIQKFNIQTINNQILNNQTMMEENLNEQNEPVFFSTYACTGVLRRALANEGFLVEKRMGFQGKRNSTIATRI